MLFSLILLVAVVYGNFSPGIIGKELPGDDGMDLIPTPHGWRPRKCVIRHDSNDVYLTYDERGTYAHYRDTGVRKFFPVDADCVANAKIINANFGKNKKKDKPSPFAWDIDAGYSPPGNMGVFNSTYQIPNQSPPCSGSSLLYWFIGYQNNDGSGGGVTIVQPVVNYQYSKWVMEPWNCCPSGQSNTGKQIPAGPGISFPAWIDAKGPSSTVAIGMSYGGQQSVLTVQESNRNYDWCCVTLEQYGAGCSNYPDQPFNFTNMVLTDLSGTNLNAQWSAGTGACQGGAKIGGSSTVQIYGKNMQ